MLISASIRLLGKPMVTSQDGTAMPGMGPGKPFAILAYLLIRGESRRDELIALLWGEGEEAKSRNAFRQSLHRLKSALGADIFKTERDHVSIVPSNNLWCDVTAFEEALAAGNTEEAVKLYRGPLMDGFLTGEAPFDNWVFDEQTRLRLKHQSALQQWVQDALAKGQWELAVQRSELLLQAAPLETDAAVLSANALVAAGRRSEALAILKAFVVRFSRDLEQPSPPVVKDMITRLEGSRGDSGKGSARGDTDDIKVEAAVHQETSHQHPAELARMLKTWKRVQSGKGGGTILIKGGTGSGKTGLLAEFTSQISALDSVLLLRGIERTGSATLPYSSVAEALRGVIGAPGVAGASQHLLAEAARLLPELKDQFNLPEPGSSDDDASRVRFFEGIAALIDAAAYEQPVCLVLEDLHNASEGTVELVHYLSIRLKDSAVLLLLSYRSNAAITQRLTDVPLGLTLEQIDLGGDDAEQTSLPPSLTKTQRWRQLLSTRPAILASSVLIALSAIAIAASIKHIREGRPQTTFLTDTLVLSEQKGPHDPATLYQLTGSINDDPEELPENTDSLQMPEWVRNISLPWINPSVSPNNHYVAMERMSANGTDVYLISMDRLDTIPLAVGTGDDVISGWSPDGNWVLIIRTSTSHAPSNDLYAYPARRGAIPIPLDTSSTRSVSHATWSPNGMHIAWSTRSNYDNQQDIFVSRMDGSNIINVSNNPAEDYNPAWSPDGTWIVFTSERDGSADLYAIEPLTGRLRRLTWSAGQDDHASFSPDGHFVAYESVNEGERNIYVTAFWGGTPKRVALNGNGRRLSIAGWRGTSLPYINKILIDVPKEFSGDTSASVKALDQHGKSIQILDVEWTVLDNAVVRFQAAPTPRTSEALEDYVPSGRLFGLKPGPARLVANAGGWRAETTFVVVK